MKPPPLHPGNPLLIAWGNARARQRSWRIRSQSRKIPGRPTPKLFLLGNQKSGTTAIATLLAEHTGGSATIDLPPAWLALPDLLKDAFPLADFVHRHRAAFNVDIVKEPWLTDIAPRLHNEFPQAQLVLIVRDPRRNIRSILDRLQLPGTARKTPRLIRQRRIKHGWLEMFTGEHAHYIDVLATRWNQLAMTPQTHPELPVTILRYEDFVNDKVGTIQQLADQFGLPHISDIASLVDIQYQPRGRNRGIAPGDFFGANLARIETLCRDGMRLHQYPCTGEQDA